MNEKGPNGGARNHHFVPQFYLKGFAKLRSKNARLHACDFKERKRFPTHPRNVASKRDFNRVDIEGQDPNFVETRLSEIEGESDQAFRRIISAESIESRDDFSYALVLMARLFVNNPHFRGVTNKFLSEVASNMMHMAVASKERWESSAGAARIDGVDLPDIPFEEIRDAVVNKTIVPTVAKEFMIAQEMELWPEMVSILDQRHWTLMVTNSTIGDFATADRPVSLRWDNEEMNKGPYGVGLGCTNTTVIFPLSKHLAVSGSFECDNGVVPATVELVANVNLRTVVGAMRQVYSADDFPIIDPDYAIRPFSQSMIWQRICNRLPDQEEE